MKTYNILQNYCRNIFLVGSGNFWYEGDVAGDDTSTLYKTYSFILFSIYGFTTVLEILAAVIGDFPDDEKSDATTFAVSHSLVMIKFYSVISKKKLIRSLNQNMIKICETYEKPQLMIEKYEAIKMNILGYVVAVYGTVAFFIFEGLRKMNEGKHFLTVVTYYPASSDYSFMATAFRLCTTLVLMMMMITMIVSVDCYTMLYLILYKYKFITLRHYIEDLKKEFDRVSETGDLKLAAEKLTKGLIEGIVMHGELLRMSKDIHSAFGTVMAIQICQSSGSAVSLLLQIALADQLPIVATMKIIFFVIGLFFLLGLFLCSAGEITHQASLLADSIFYCGWQACPPQQAARHNIRSIVLQACAQARRPLVMKAFKMIELTYATFILVLRSTYSVFALIYAQNK